MISFAHFQVQLFGSFTGGDGRKAVEEHLSDAAALRRPADREQQQLRFAADDRASAKPTTPSSSRASDSQTPLIGSRPAHCGAVQASP